MPATIVHGSRVSEEATSIRKDKILPPNQPSRILVADDEHLVAAGLAATLRELGFDVVAVARDGADAVEMAQSLRPDLAMLDVRMPRVNGVEAAQTIFRSLGIPVVVLSAISDDEFVSCAATAGVFGYLLKPVSQEQLRVNLAIAWGRFLEHTLQSTEILDLRERLADRRIIEQAKWIIVKTKGIDEPEAQRLLQRLARNNRRTLADVARSIVENEQLLGDLSGHVPS